MAEQKLLLGRQFRFIKLFIERDRRAVHFLGDASIIRVDVQHERIKNWLVVAYRANCLRPRLNNSTHRQTKGGDLVRKRQIRMIYLRIAIDGHRRVLDLRRRYPRFLIAQKHRRADQALAHAFLYLVERVRRDLALALIYNANIYNSERVARRFSASTIRQIDPIGAKAAIVQVSAATAHCFPDLLTALHNSLFVLVQNTNVGYGRLVSASLYAQEHLVRFEQRVAEKISRVAARRQPQALVAERNAFV